MPAKPTRVSFKQQAIAFAVATAFQPCVLAQTLPSGGQVVAGQASISQPTPSSLHIHQGSDKAILNWQSFSIGAGAQVNFQQPASSSVALNRVLGNNPSQIFGQLSANGRVFLVNPSGILFGQGASVSVGGLVASTLSITDDDFMAGRYVFSNSGGAGSVVNQGNIFSHSGYTALLGPQVSNDGLIVASVGSVALAAGDRVSLDMVGDGLISVNVEQAAMDALAVNRGSIEAGRVLLTAHSANALLDTVVNTEGFIRAVSMVERNGEIVLDGGTRGTVAIGGQVSSDGHLAVTGGDVAVSGFVSSSGGQSVAARSLTVNGLDGRTAFLSNSGGDQVIAISGEGSSSGIDVVATGGGFASISHNDPAYVQTIAVTDADHISVSGLSGGAGIFAGSSAQRLSITGSGRNAITVGSEGGTGLSVLNALDQGITAGSAGQSGSITLAGPIANNAFVGVTTNSGAGAEAQSVSTSGALRVIGGTAPAQGPNTPTGIFHNRQGRQTIRAASIEITGGPSGSGNGAFVNSNGGGDQWIEITGGSIAVSAGQGGANNGAGLGSARGGDQTILGVPDIFVSGGATSNASVQAGLGRSQTIEAGNIFLTNAASSPGNSAGVILGSHQRIDATGDMILTSRSGTGTSSGVRIGAAGSGATDLVLTVGGNLVLTGGTTGTNGAGLGGAGSGATSDNNIIVNAIGDVILDGAVGGAGARIGSSAATPVQGGNISVTGRSIQFTGSAAAAIRTLGDVELRAGEISQAPNGFILANALTTTSNGSTSLGGPNQVSAFNGTRQWGSMSPEAFKSRLTASRPQAWDPAARRT